MTDTAATETAAKTIDVLTPDFVVYPWTPITSATVDGNFANVAWADGVTLRCFSLWLYENTVGVEPLSREAMIDPSDLPPADHLTGAEVGPSGELVITWADGSTSPTHPGWLRHVAEGRHTPQAALPELRTWTAADVDGLPPTVDGTRVLEDPDVLREWLRLLCEYGMARLVDAPATETFMAELAALVGPIRGSNFGGVFDVRSMLEPDSTANTGLNLGQHSDLPTRETPPGFQFLHCIANEVAGGWSRLTDSHAVAVELERTNPDAFEALSTLEWTFNNRSPVADHRWTGPFLDGPIATKSTLDRRPLTVRAFYPVRGFPAMPEDQIERGYEAMRAWSELAHDPRFQIRFPFAPGTLIGFDNRRVLHGRDAFEPSAGLRWLRGCYIDQDDVYSTLRVMGWGRNT